MFIENQLYVRKILPENSEMLSSMNNWILCVKIVLISSGAVSLVTATKFAIPMMVEFTVNELPSIWLAMLSLLKPPYLYFIVNGIIIAIVAASRFTDQSESFYNDQSQPSISPPPVEISAALAVVEEPATEEVVVYEVEKVVDVMKPVVVHGLDVVGNEDEVENEDVAALWSTYTLSQKIISQEEETETEKETDGDTEIILPVTEKPLELSMFSHPKQLKPNTEGEKARRMARPEPETEETLESTWRMITEGRRQVQPTRQMKKSGTFKDHGIHMDMMVADENSFPQNPHVRKSETFKDRVNFKDRTNYNDSLMNFEKIRKEPSLSQDELNHRVEAFIQKFNEEMRLQRQESLKQYREMLKRGADH